LWGATLLQPFDDQRVAEILKDQPDLLAAVRADDQLRAVASTPLVLGLFAFAFADLGGEAARLRDLATGPANLRSRITRAFVERRLLHESRRWSEAGDPSLIPDVGEIYQVLGAVAKELALERGRYTVTGRELGTIVGKKNVTRWTELGERLHLLRPVDRDDWRFIHLLIQDHFAVQPLMDELRDRDSWQREQAAEVLAELGDPRAIDCLLEVLRDRSDKKEVRAAAASALSAFDQPEVREALFALLEAAGRKKLAPDLRPPVVLTLGRLGDERVREELISCAHREFQPTAYGHSDLSHWYDNDRGIARDAAEILRPSADPAAQAAVKAYEEREKWSEAERWREWSEQSDYEGHFE
jgi:hypothetical protein